MTPDFARSEALSSLRHGFFGRQGGVSTGDFSGLNMSVSVGDDAAAVAENRARAMAALGRAKLAFLKQVHSNRVVVLDDALPQGDVEADGMVTRRKAVLLGILYNFYCSRYEDALNSSEKNVKKEEGGV